jgi:hypothetical protein
MTRRYTLVVKEADEPNGTLEKKIVQFEADTLHHGKMHYMAFSGKHQIEFVSLVSVEPIDLIVYPEFWREQFISLKSALAMEGIVVSGGYNKPWVVEREQ